MRTMVWLSVTVFAGLALALAGCGSDNGDEEGEAQAGEGIVNVELMEQNESGESGTAELRAEGETTVVEISLDGAPAEAQPAHIHEGTCEDLNAQPAYPLEDVVNGTSTSTEEVPLEELKSGQYAINVHKSASEADVYVACGNIGTGSGTGGGSDEGGSDY